MNNKSDIWLDWAMELQSLGQAGLAYTDNRFDIERFERIREIAAEMLSLKSGLPTEIVKDLFCCEKGYQTPKLDTRAAVFENGQILLVEDGFTHTWELPGGWVDVTQSLCENTIKEVKEEAGLDVVIDKLIAVQDRDKHNLPRYPYKIIKAFFLCKRIGGKFTPNIETSDSGYFALDNLPVLSTQKNTVEQIKMCFDAFSDDNWKVFVD